MRWKWRYYLRQGGYVFALVCESACLCVVVIGITPKKLLTNFDEFLDGAVCDYQELISCWQ